MDSDDKNKKHFAMQETKLTNSATPSSIFSVFFRPMQSVNLLHLSAAILQVGLGSVVVLIGLFGFIEPFWISINMVITASIATMVGLYFLYSLIGVGDRNRLLNDAIRRIMNAQN